MKKILFVCLGNICRSPAAEGAFLALLKKEGLEKEYIVDSAGTSGFHEGDLPDLRMINRAKLRGIELPTRSRPLIKNDFLNFDLIICMDKSNLSNAKRIAPTEFISKLVLFSKFKNKIDFLEVPDPYYGSEKDFDHVLDIVEDASIGLFLSLKNA